MKWAVKNSWITSLLMTLTWLPMKEVCVVCVQAFVCVCVCARVCCVFVCACVGPLNDVPASDHVGFSVQCGLDCCFVLIVLIVG